MINYCTHPLSSPYQFQISIYVLHGSQKIQNFLFSFYSFFRFIKSLNNLDVEVEANNNLAKLIRNKCGDCCWYLVNRRKKISFVNESSAEKTPKEE